MSSKSHEGLVEEGTVYDNSSLFSEYGMEFLAFSYLLILYLQSYFPIEELLKLYYHFGAF